MNSEHSTFNILQINSVIVAEVFMNNAGYDFFLPFGLDGFTGFPNRFST
jgi:hypothetical protein